MDLTDVANFLKGCNALAHNNCLLWAIHNLLHGNRFMVTSVNDALVKPNRCECAACIKDGPVTLNEISMSQSLVRQEVGNIQFLCQLIAMECLVEFVVKQRINHVEVRVSIFPLVEHGAAINV
jgi:hypothetical protein